MQVNRKNRKVFAADFETSVYENQNQTEVWASACGELYTDNVYVFTSIEQQFNFFSGFKEHILAYYHNLKFDGQFWLYYFLAVKKYKLAYDEDNHNWIDDKEMHNNTFKVMISDLGQWYFIRLKINNVFIEFRDSFKLLPFSLDSIGKSFKTKHQKTSIEYTGERHANGILSNQEIEYIKNDVYVLKEALEIMYDNGNKNITIGSCCFGEYIKDIPRMIRKDIFPDLFKTKFLPKDQELFVDEKFDNFDEYIRKAYKGGWCYVKPEKKNKLYTRGCTADVNSLYPSVMSGESGNRYPVGYPLCMWHGNYFPDEFKKDYYYYFIRIKCRFKIKKGYLPFIQIKDSYFYNSNDCLTTSDLLVNGKYVSKFRDDCGNIRDTRVILTLTCTDYELFLQHYNVMDFEILDGVIFSADVGQFDKYINKYKEIKIQEKGAKRQLAKLYLNNLYGKFGTSPRNGYKIPEYNGERIVFTTYSDDTRPVIYIPIACAVTSYARKFTITAAQQNYDNFIYADTDSIHCHCRASDLKGIKVHDTDFLCWKLESEWDIGYFVRQKTYIEHVIKENQEKIDNPYYNIKCAGMPDRCKDLLLLSMGEKIKLRKELNEEEKNFIKKKRTIQDFKVGLQIPSKLVPKTIKGGVILQSTTYELRQNIRIRF